MAEEMDKTGDYEQGSNCKRKLNHEFSMVPDDRSSNVDGDFSLYGFTNLPDLNEFDPSGLDLDCYTEEPQVRVLEVEDWKDPMATKLEELLMSNLDSIFRNAVRKVVDLGYSQEMVESALSRKALYAEGDPLMNIVCYTVKNLKEKCSENIAEFEFQNFKQLLHYFLVEMIGILRELMPSITVTEAMWELLIHDLSIMRVIRAEDQSSDASSEQSSDKSSVPPSKPEVQSVDVVSDSSLTTSQKGSQESKSGSNSKLNSRKELALALRQKFIHMEKTKACGKGGVKLAKLTSVSGLIVEKRLKPQCEIPNQKMKRGSSSTKGVGKAEKGVSIAGVCHVSTNDDSALPEGCSLPTEIIKPKPKLCSSVTQKVLNYCARIPFDKISGKYIPRDEKDGQILKLVSRAQELQDELQRWNDWTNKKVMQVADRLRKIQAESKSLKNEMEAYRKERKALEENAEKRITEVENATENNKKQIQSAASSIFILETKKSLLEKELESARLLAEQSMATHQEALERERMAIQQAQSWKSEKGLLQDELEKEKQTLSKLQQEIEKGKNVLANTEGRVKKEKAKTEKILAQAAYFRKEREQYEARMKAEEDAIRKKAASELQEYVESMVKLENEIAKLRLKSNSNKSISSVVKENKKSETATTGSSEGGKLLKREHECVMCLSEERSVVFLPCAHQVLCPTCNELHEKQGMKECPSCRTPIEFRIHAKFLGQQ
ncbi:unnamed protein product [Lathyrus oleraceus]|uniref:RING-type domain-containing protein n=1 Tax=Pisum sativum TaxID=3888 RepID=A0A9D5A8D8_PEA|nr:putative E3 ubiquitin-protein ligase RF4 [Pisum sativum]KAI5399279.1 hypothetical protein KIW84_064592 [Pisum sativum]